MNPSDFFQAGNLQYLESAYADYKEDPESVDPSLRHFFAGFDAAREHVEVDKKTGAVTKHVPSEFIADFGFGESSFEGKNMNDDQERVFELISAYRKYGHLQARINPIGEPAKTRFLDLKEHGLGEHLLDKEYYTGALPGPEKRKLRDIIQVCEAIYCSTLSVEYVGIVQDVDEFRWIQKTLEKMIIEDTVGEEQRYWIYKHLYHAAAFENFLHKKYVGQKRFSLEGLDSMVPMLHAAIDELAKHGTEEVMLGMAHRGRLNVLTNVMGKPHELVMAEFEGTQEMWSKGDGDVKYHMGYFNELETLSGKKVSMYLNPNPSHLELVNPVIQGKVYSRQKVIGDDAKERVVPILIHGDAAFAGQGINMEVLQMSQLRGYAVGGTIHIIADNQIGFTANPPESRTTRYPTDLFKMADCPVFHANADDPEAVVQAMRFAVMYRQKFKKDVGVHLLGYRRYGHNEGDEPAFTQPMMYRLIRKHPSCYKIYREALEQLDMNLPRIEGIEKEFDDHLQLQIDAIQAKQFTCVSTNVEPGWMDVWEEDLQKRKTGVPLEVLEKIVRQISVLPESLAANKKIAKFVNARIENWAKDKIDWAFAEALCFGSLLLENYRVRLSGQDARRGTFSQRNLVVYDENIGEEYIPLNHIQDGQQTICVFNSLLSELAVLGFEYGFALGNPETLVMWEAQFGDFANGAQAMMDVFIASGESKWQSKNGMVMLLPHGYEGQGPEHSSARLERYLQLCADYNLRVANPTTPANYFHVLRRQIMKRDRRPLVLMTPKMLLRYKHCISTRADFDKEEVFKKVIVGQSGKTTDPASVKRIILCSGKVYYDLLQFSEENDLQGYEFVRLEQIYPFPFKTLQRVVESYPNLKEFFWVQEERKNMGAWSFVESRLRELLQPYGIEPTYIGRNAGSSPCSGSSRVHKQEQDKLTQEAFA